MKLVALSYFFVAIGGALGAMARYAFNVALQRDSYVPLGTLGANLLGCLIMGFLAHLVANSALFNASGIIPDQHRLLFAVGFCGSFTTMSAFMFEMNEFIQRSEIFSTLSYLLVTIVGCFACFYAGFVIARLLWTGSGA